MEQRKQTTGPSPSLRTSQKLVGRLAEKYGVPPDALLGCLRDTAFKVKKDEAPFSDTELAAALIIAEQHDLNPFARDIYVTRSHGKLLVIVPIDGWSKIVNRQPSYDGCEFETTFDEKGKPFSITCRIYRKDRSHCTEVTEYLGECHRDTEPWGTWPNRMLRHKSFIQAARYAFSLGGMMDDDEAEGMLDVEKSRPAIEDRRQRALPAPAELRESPWTSAPGREEAELQREQLEQELAAAAAPLADEPSSANEPAEEFTAPAPVARPTPAKPAPTGGDTTPWGQWNKIRAQLRPEDLLECKQAAGIDYLTPKTPTEMLAKAVAKANELLKE